MSKYSDKEQLAKILVGATLALIGIPIVLMALVPNTTFKLVMTGAVGVGVIGVNLIIYCLTTRLRNERDPSGQECDK